VVKRIGQIRDDNPTTSLKDPDGAESMNIGDHIKLDAHDVAKSVNGRHLTLKRPHEV
jgi:hypothetical protein